MKKKTKQKKQQPNKHNKKQSHEPSKQIKESNNKLLASIKFA